MKDQGKKDQSHLPTVLAAAMALLASSSGVKATDSQQNTVPPAKRQNEDEPTPALVLTPPSDSGILIAGHSSHSSHSSHYSSSGGGGDDVPSTPYYPPPTAPSLTTPSYTLPTPTPPPQPEPPPVTQLDSVVLEKLAKLPSLWPKKVKLIQKFTFTMIHDGVATGQLDAPAGTNVDLIAVKGAKLIVSLLDNKAEVDAAITDIGDRVNINTIISSPLPTSPPATNAPPATATPPATNTAPQGAIPSLSSGGSETA